MAENKCRIWLTEDDRAFMLGLVAVRMWELRQMIRRGGQPSRAALEQSIRQYTRIKWKLYRARPERGCEDQKVMGGGVRIRKLQGGADGKAF